MHGKTAKKILLTGRTGQVGWELQRTLMSLGEVIAVGREQLDLANPDSIRACMRSLQPDIVVNPAAYTAVDKAESEPELAMQINGIAPRIFAEEAMQLGAKLVHYSTDYVFNGQQKNAYTEIDATDPLGVYGSTKLIGEQAIQAVGVPHLILRTCWVYSRMGKNFLLTMLRLARERKELRVVSDQIGSPTWSRLIAEVTAQILIQLGDDADLWRDRSGIYHLSASGETSWYGFTQAILANDPQHSEQMIEQLTPITTAAYPTPAQRPAYSLLNTTKLNDTFQIYLPHWEALLKLALS